MTSISPVSNQIIPQEHTSTLCRLPKDTLHKIFSYLSTNEIQVVVLVNKHLCKNAIAAASFNEPELVKVFIRTSADRLRGFEVFHVQASQLNHIMSTMPPLFFLNLKEIKHFIFSVKSQLSLVLKSIPKESFDALLEDNKPSGFIEDLEKLIDCERKIDAAFQIPDEDDRDMALERICCDDLIPLRNFDRAFKVAHLITNDQYYGERALRNISVALAKAGKFHQAIDLASQITDPYERDNTLSPISIA
ncbi:hypothetical protein EBU95_20005, partial [bacterium]|nr:hypothetical protein [bacterium]